MPCPLLAHWIVATLLPPSAALPNCLRTRLQIHEEWLYSCDGPCMGQHVLDPHEATIVDGLVQVTGQHATCGSASAQAALRCEAVACAAVSGAARCFSAVAELAHEPPSQVIAMSPEVRYPRRGLVASIKCCVLCVAATATGRGYGGASLIIPCRPWQVDEPRSDLTPREVVERLDRNIVGQVRFAVRSSSSGIWIVHMQTCNMGTFMDGI
jgi:hypothetical protein